MINNETDLSINYGNILLALSESQNNFLHFNVDQSQLTIIPTDAMDDGPSDEGDIATYFVNGVNLFANNLLNDVEFTDDSDKGELEAPRIISIYIKPQSSITSLDNSSTNATFDLTDTSLLDKELIQNITNQPMPFNTLNLDGAKEVTILVPEEELALMNQTNITTTTNEVTQSNDKKKKKKNTEPAIKAGTIHYPLPETDIQLNIRAFDLIYYNSHKIKLPSPMWGFHKNSVDKDIIIFSKAKWFKSSNVLIPPIYEKQVIFHESNDIKIYINNKFSPLEVRRPRDIGELEVILKHVDETPVCQGGPSIAECDTGPCAQKDYTVGKWRHKLCPIIVAADEPVCKFCTTINQVHRYPKKKRLPFGRRNPAKDKES